MTVLSRLEDRVRLAQERARAASLASRRTTLTGNTRHQIIDQRLEALEAQVATLTAALAAHKGDNQRHTGKLTGVL